MDMIVSNTPLESHRTSYGLLVKREDLCCPPPGPPFSKARGVLAHVKARYSEGVRLFGVLDTYHSQAGHAVAMACREVGAECVNYWPQYKHHEFDPLRPAQQHSRELGARLCALPAGRSAILFHQAKRLTESEGGYMMPNALKLPESVTETAAEVLRTFANADYETTRQLSSLPWLVACSSGTIAAGVVRGLKQAGTVNPRVILHMGYDRSEIELERYVLESAGVSWSQVDLRVINEHYNYADEARTGETPPWPCNSYYDLKAFRWWMHAGREQYNSHAVLWNIG